MTSLVLLRCDVFASPKESLAKLSSGASVQRETLVLIRWVEDWNGDTTQWKALFIAFILPYLQFLGCSLLGLGIGAN
jgi:hypothetical protein